MRTKLCRFFVLAIALILAPAIFGQGEKNGFPPDSRMESRQGYPGQSDVVAHRFVSKGTHFECIQVEHHPKESEDRAACQLKFQDGTTRTLEFNETTQAAIDGEVYLECLGDKPTKCVAGLWEGHSTTRQ